MGAPAHTIRVLKVVAVGVAFLAVAVPSLVGAASVAPGAVDAHARVELAPSVKAWASPCRVERWQKCTTGTRCQVNRFGSKFARCLSKLKKGEDCCKTPHSQGCAVGLECGYQGKCVLATRWAMWCKEGDAKRTCAPGTRCQKNRFAAQSAVSRCRAINKAGAVCSEGPYTQGCAAGFECGRSGKCEAIPRVAATGGGAYGGRRTRRHY